MLSITCVPSGNEVCHGVGQKLWDSAQKTLTEHETISNHINNKYDTAQGAPQVSKGNRRGSVLPFPSAS